MARPSWAPSGVDMDRPSVARVYDSLLGGFHNFACDRELAARMTELVPAWPRMARAFRAFLRRSVRFCAENGIDQFLDVGSGIPTAGNVHEIAQRASPGARVVYVDVDPVAVAHSEAILADNPLTVTIQADIRQPKQILGDADLRRLLDFNRPVAVLMLAVLPFLPDAENPVGVVGDFHDAVAPGSLLVISHPSSDGELRERIDTGVSMYTSAVASPVQLRSRDEIVALFHEFELIEPGLVPLGDWRPDPADDPPDTSAVDATAPLPLRFAYGGIGRKP